MISFIFLFTLVFYPQITCTLASPQYIDVRSMDSTQGITFKDSSTNSGFGNSVSKAGDVNGDGVADIVFSQTASTMTTGFVYVIFGSSEVEGLSPSTDLNGSKGFKISAPSATQGFGIIVSGLGDVNGDGLGDIGIASSGNSKVYVIYGRKGDSSDIVLSSGFSSSQGYVIDFASLSSAALPTSLKGAGDINGDKIGDIIVGLGGYSSSTGIVFVIYGRKSLSSILNPDSVPNPSQWLMISSSSLQSIFGKFVSPAGDLNGDKIDDIMVTASGFNGGTVYVIYGSSSRQGNIDLSAGLTGNDCYILANGPLGSSFGVPLSLGDINGDGSPDLVAGTSTTAKTSYVVYGNDKGFSGVSIASSSQVSVMAPDQSSSSCNIGFIPGDMDGDGFAEAVIRCTKIGSYGSVLFVLSGSSLGIPRSSFPSGFDSGSSSGFAVFSPASNFGVSLDAAGDFNNDFLMDFIVSETTSSAVYVIFGSNGCPKNCSTCISGTVCTACFGNLGLYKTQCVASCPKGTFLSEGNCVDCPNGCTECTTGGVCQSCKADYVLQSSQCVAKGASMQANITGAALDGAAALGNTVTAGSSSATNFGLAAKILRNIRYLNITVSSELQETFDSWKISSGFIGIPGGWSDESNSELLPQVFGRYNVGDLFLVNYWKTLVMILIGLVVFIPFKLLEGQCFKNRKIRAIMRSGNVIASNFIFSQLYGSLDDIIFYLVLQARSGYFESAFAKINFGCSIVFTILAILMFCTHMIIIRRYQQAKKNDQEKFLQKYENFKMLFIDFQDTSFFKQSFLLIYVTRSIISNLIISNLFAYPLLQTLMLTPLNLLILAYLIFYKPFKTSLNMLGQYFCESVLLVVNVSMLAMAFINNMVSQSEDTTKIFSKLVIICNWMLIIGSLVFMILTVLMSLYLVYQDKKAQKNIPEKLKFNRKTTTATFDQSVLDLSQSQVISDDSKVFALPFQVPRMRGETISSPLKNYSASQTIVDASNFQLEQSAVVQDSFVFQSPPQIKPRLYQRSRGSPKPPLGQGNNRSYANAKTDYRHSSSRFAVEKTLNQQHDDESQAKTQEKTGQSVNWNNKNIHQLSVNFPIKTNPEPEGKTIESRGNQERDYEKFLRRKANESSAAYIKKRWLEKFQNK